MYVCVYIHAKGNWVQEKKKNSKANQDKLKHNQIFSSNMPGVLG